GNNTFNFATPYFWDGISNLIVQTNWSNQNTSGSGTGGNTGLVYHTVSPNRTTYTYGDLRTATQFLPVITGNVAGSGGTATATERPNTVFLATLGCNSNRVEFPITI